MGTFSLWQAMLGASNVVKVVIGVLIGSSLLSWTLILARWFFFRDLKRASERFLRQFHKTRDLKGLYERLKLKSSKLEGLEYLLYMGFSEYFHLKALNLPREELNAGVKRVLELASERELSGLDRHLTLLATIGSVSPYIGLFGTVWGIMTAFHALGAVQHVTMALVAPGISEALITTAIGLFAAIPAVMAYNYFAEQAAKITAAYELFRHECQSILQH